MATVAEALAQARLSYRVGDYQKAATVAMQVLQADASQVEALDLLGGICLAQGRLAEAAGCYRRVLHLRPDDSSHTSLGIVLFRLGQLDQALPHFREALRRTPDSPAAHNNLGLILKDLGQAAQAESCFRAALRLQPNLAEAHSNLGLALKAQGKLDEALACLQQALHLKPDSPEIHNNLGLVHKEREQLEEAVAGYREAIRLRPGYAEAHSNLGNALRELGRLEEAVASLGVALHLNPGSAEAHCNLGVAFNEQGKLEEARASLFQAFRLRPDSPEVLNDLGLVLREQGKMEEALAHYQQALRFQPDNAEVHLNVGLLLQEVGRLDEAEASIRQALRLKTTSSTACNTLGTVLQDQGKLEAAEASIQQALSLQPDYPEAHYSLATLSLLRGDFERGWDEFEWRWQVKDARQMRRHFRQPLWDGSPLPERTILLYAEQGLGDTLQFIRYAALVKQRVGRVLFECPPALLRLLGRCAGIDQLLPKGAPLPDFDVQVPLMSLPRVFGTTLGTVPASIPYLDAEPDLVERWRRDLAAFPGFKIGIGWKGNPRNRRDRLRSIPLSCYEPLARLEGAHLFSLQKGAGREQLPDFAARAPITDLGSRLDETTGAFVDTAAVLRSLDLVITSDTTLAHLAGGLGVPVWVLLLCVPEFRWLLDRSDSPWYPTMRLFRQERPGDWQGVFQRITAALAERLPVSRPTIPRCRPIRVEIAAGELIDKMTILQIKSRRLTDAVQLRHVQTELDGLQLAYHEAVVTTAALETLTVELRTVNETLWQIEDDIRLCERDQDFGPRFIALARAVYQHNDRRAALKRQINDLLGSRLIEEKAYAAAGSLPPGALPTGTAGTASDDQG